VNQQLSLQLKALKIEFEQEFKFHPERKWKADFHIVGKKILVEVEGGIWSGGRHTRGKGYIGDMEKYNSATMMGYQVIRFSTEQVKSGLAIKQIEKMVGDLG
jgi:very-short-patch-repair endonuclease